MDFFAHQDRARKATFWLLLLYLLAMATVVLAIDLVVGLFWLWVVHDHQVWHGVVHGLAQVPPVLYRYASIVCVATILGGSVYRIVELAQGGKVVAQQLGGRKLQHESADPYERRLLNVVEEMSLAAGMPMLPVYVLDDAADINAFAAGWSPQDAVLGVSRGAVRLLNRDELQGVMAHEFGHVCNGDMRLNTLMTGLLNGLLVVALAGDWLIGPETDSDLYRRSTRSSSSLGLVGLGFGLYALGYLGVFLGNVIQAAVSRQRELLADASAVQYTRNPDGIGRALRKIGGTLRRSGAGGPRVTPYSHLFFFGGADGIIASLTATHPPLDQRIAAIYGGQFMPLITVVIEEPPDQDNKPSAAVAARRSLSAPLQAAVASADSAPALVFALVLAAPDTPLRKSQLALLDAPMAARVTQLAQSLGQQRTGKGGRLALLDQALASLTLLDAEARRELVEKAARLAAADGHIDLQEFALMTLLENRLTPAPNGSHTQGYVSLADRFEDVRLVLSLVAHSGAAVASAEAYSDASQVVGLPLESTLLPRPALQLGAVRSAMRRLNQLLPLQKQTIIKACTQCVTHDGRIEPLEADLLRAVCASLDVPVPQPIS